MNRRVLRRVHRAAAITAFATILTFWTSTVVTELFATTAAVAAVKTAILWGMAVLIPAMAIAGATGFKLGGAHPHPLAAAKRRRMPIIALNGLLVLVPAAVFLAQRAAAGRFDRCFVAVQALELIAGAVNIVLMGLNIRDGIALARRGGGAVHAASA